MDTLKFTSVDIDLRVLVDFQIIKSMGIFGLPKDLQWVYSFISPDFVRHMKKGLFVALSNRGPLGIGSFNSLPWHKQEKEDIIKQVGLKIEYGEEPVPSIDRYKYRTVGDREHTQILSLYISEGKSMQKIANQQKRSVATIHKQIRDHDGAVARSGFCPACKRVHGKHQAELTRKGGVKDWMKEVLNL